MQWVPGDFLPEAYSCCHLSVIICGVKTINQNNQKVRNQIRNHKTKQL
jgi:hypothetical protein